MAWLYRAAVVVCAARVAPSTPTATNDVRALSMFFMSIAPPSLLTSYLNNWMRASLGRDARTGRESSPLREVAEGEFTGGRPTAKLARLTIVVITSNAWFMPQGIQAGTEQRKPSS